ncbi:MAG: polysaccharide deacetylase family protein [Nitrospirae bacterium]|nr:polysaccharide deacetylase family protein [Nitrospirota bacterium]
MTAFIKLYAKNIIGLLAQTSLIKTIISIDCCPIFMFHRITDKKVDNNYLSIDANSFERIILFLKKEFRIIDLMSWIKGQKNNKSGCVITFDDGWLDNYTNAFPILKKYNIPATIFLCAGMVGTNQGFWFERTSNLINTIDTNGDLENAKKYFSTIIPKEKLNIIKDKKGLLWQINNELKKMHPNQISNWLDEAETSFSIKFDKRRSVMNWEEIKEMSYENISFGSHGMSHSILTILSREEKYYEINQSKKILEGANINFVPALTFPNGNYDQEVLDVAEEAGYKLLLTASIKKCGSGVSPLLANRIGVTEYNSINNNLLIYSIFVAKMLKKL